MTRSFILKGLAVIVIVGAVSVLFLKLNQQGSFSQSVSVKIYQEDLKLQWQQQMIEELAKAPDDSSEGDKLCFQNFKKLLTERKDLSELYFVTRSIFGPSQSGFAVARFVAMYPILGGVIGFNELTAWNDREINKNPDEVLRILKSSDIYFKNKIQHQAFLNLVNKLKLPESLKTEFYAKSVVESLNFDSKGEVTAGAETFEMALMFLKQSSASGLTVEPMVKKLVSLHNNDKSKLIIKGRVSALYPELQYLF